MNDEELINIVFLFFFSLNQNFLFFSGYFVCCEIKTSVISCGLSNEIYLRVIRYYIQGLLSRHSRVLLFIKTTCNFFFFSIKFQRFFLLFILIKFHFIFLRK